MRRAVLFAAVLATAHLAHAGLIIVQEVDQITPADGKTQMTVKISGAHARVDVGNQFSSIVDLSTDTVTSLLHAQKLAMELPKGVFAAAKKNAAAHAAKPDLKPTGRKETISGYACEEYTGTFQDLDVTYWVTKDVPNQKEILAQMSQLSGGADPFKGALAGGGDFPGFPIRTVVKSPQMGSSTMTILSIKDADLPDSTFAVPADYKSMNVPKLPSPDTSAGH
jgi:hypothetical protein